MDKLVSVDLGYGPQEHWVLVKVLDRKMNKGLFDDSPREELLIKEPNGKQTWVTYWEVVGDE